jgi:hypothetical protein
MFVMYYKVSCDIFLRVKFRIFFLSILIQIWSVKHSASIFLLYFQLPYLPKETCFQQAGSSAVEGTSQDIPGSSGHRKVLAGLSLFLKSEKIPALIYEEKDLSTGPSVIFDLFPRPISLGHRSEITEGRPFSYTQSSDRELLLQGALMFVRYYQLSL